MAERPRLRRRAAGPVPAVLAVLTAALAAVLLLSGCGPSTGASGPGAAAGFTEHSSDGMNGAVLTDQYVVPEVTLTATDESDFSLTRDTNRPLTLVFFGYTHCPDICQVVMADIASALTRLDPTHREQVGMVFVTTDPARDDAATLRRYLDRFDPGFEGLTGDLGTITRVATRLGVPIEQGTRMPSGGYEVSHGTQIVAVDARDRSPIVWTEGTPAADLADDITVLLDKA